MQNFIQWLEERNEIRVVAHDKSGKITFSVNGKRYTYIMDAGYFYNGFFSNWMKYKPGKALNFAKQNGKLLEPIQAPKKEPEGKFVQQRLFPY